METGGAGLQRAVFPVALMNKGPRLGARTLCWILVSSHLLAPAFIHKYSLMLL